MNLSALWDMVVGSSGLDNQTSANALLNPSSPTSDQYENHFEESQNDSLSTDQSYSELELCEEKLPFPQIPPYMGYSYTSPYSNYGQTLVSEVRGFNMKMVQSLDNHVVLMTGLCEVQEESRCLWDFIKQHQTLVIDALGKTDTASNTHLYEQMESQVLLCGLDPVLQHRMIQCIAPRVYDTESAYQSKYLDLQECVKLSSTLHSLIDKCILSTSGLVEWAEFGEVQCSSISSLCLYCDAYTDSDSNVNSSIVAANFQSSNNGQPSQHTQPAYHHQNDLSAYNETALKLSGGLTTCPFSQTTAEGLVCTATQQGVLHSMTVPLIHSASNEENTDSVYSNLDVNAYISYRNMIYNSYEYHQQEDKTAMNASVDPFVQYIVKQYPLIQPLLSQSSNLFTNQAELLLVRQQQVLQTSICVLRKILDQCTTHHTVQSNLCMLLFDLITLLYQRPCFFPSNMQQYTTRAKYQMNVPATMLTMNDHSVQAAWAAENDLVTSRTKQFLRLQQEGDSLAQSLNHTMIKYVTAPHLPTALSSLPLLRSSLYIRARRLLSCTMSLFAVFQEAQPATVKALGLGSSGLTADIQLNSSTDQLYHGQSSSTEHFIVSKYTPYCPVKASLRSVAELHWCALPQVAHHMSIKSNSANNTRTSCGNIQTSYITEEKRDDIPKMRLQPGMTSSMVLPYILDPITLNTRDQCDLMPCIPQANVPSLTSIWGTEQTKTYYQLHEYVRAGLQSKQAFLHTLYTSNIPKVTVNHVQGTCPNEHLSDLSLLSFPHTAKDRNIQVQILYQFIPSDIVTPADMANIPLFLQNIGIQMQAFVNILRIAEQQSDMNMVLSNKQSTEQAKYASTSLLRESRNCDILRHLKSLLRQGTSSPSHVVQGNAVDGSFCRTNIHSCYPSLICPDPNVSAYIMNTAAQQNEHVSLTKQGSVDWSSGVSKGMTYGTIHTELVDTFSEHTSDSEESNSEEEDATSIELTYTMSSLDVTRHKKELDYSSIASVEENRPVASREQPVDLASDVCSFKNAFAPETKQEPIAEVQNRDSFLLPVKRTLHTTTVLDKVLRDSKQWSHPSVMHGFPYSHQSTQGPYKLLLQDIVPVPSVGGFQDQFGQIQSQLSVFVANTFTLATQREQMAVELHSVVMESKAEIIHEIEAWLVVWLYTVQTVQCGPAPTSTSTEEFNHLLVVLMALWKNNASSKALICATVMELLGKLLDVNLLLAHHHHSFSFAVVATGAIIRSLDTFDEAALLDLRKTILRTCTSTLTSSLVRVLQEYTTVHYLLDCADFTTGLLQHHMETSHRMVVDHVVQQRKLAQTSQPNQEGLLLSKLPLHVIHQLLKPSDGERRSLQDTCLKYMTSDSGEPPQKVLQPELSVCLSMLAKQKYDPSFISANWLLMHRVLAYNVACTPQPDTRPGLFTLHNSSVLPEKCFVCPTSHKVKAVAQICLLIPAPPLLSPFAALQPQFLQCLTAQPSDLSTRALPRFNLCDSLDVLHPHSIPSSPHSIISWVQLKNTPAQSKKATSTMLNMVDQLFQPTLPPINTDIPFQVGQVDQENHDAILKEIQGNAAFSSLLAKLQETRGMNIGNYTLYNHDQKTTESTLSKLASAFLGNLHKFPMFLLALRAFTPIAHAFLTIPSQAKHTFPQMTSSGVPSLDQGNEVISGTFWHEYMVHYHNSAAGKYNKTDKKIQISMNRLIQPHEATPVYTSIAFYQSFCAAESEQVLPLPYNLHNAQTDALLDLDLNDTLIPEFQCPSIAFKNQASAPCLQLYTKYKTSVEDFRLYFLQNVISSVEQELHEARYMRHARNIIENVPSTYSNTSSNPFLPGYLTLLKHYSGDKHTHIHSVSSLLVHSPVVFSYKAIHPINITATPSFIKPLTSVSTSQVLMQNPSFPDQHLAESTTIMLQSDQVKQTLDILQRSFPQETAFLGSTWDDNTQHNTHLPISQVRVPYGLHTLMAVTHNAVELLKNTSIQHHASVYKGTDICHTVDETNSLQVVAPHPAIACQLLHRQTIISQARSAIRRVSQFGQLNALYSSVTGTKEHVQFVLLKQRLEDYMNNTNLLPSVLHGASTHLTASPVQSLLHHLMTQSDLFFVENIVNILFLDAAVPEFNTHNIQTYLQQPYTIPELLFLAQLPVTLSHTQYSRLHTPVSIHGRPLVCPSPAREHYGMWEITMYQHWYRTKGCSYAAANMQTISHDIHNVLFNTSMDILDQDANNAWQCMLKQPNINAELAAFIQRKNVKISSEMQFLLNHTVSSAYLLPNLTRTQMLQFYSVHKPLLQDSDVQFLPVVVNPRVRNITEFVVPFPAPITVPLLYTKESIPQANYQTLVLQSTLNAMYNGFHSYTVHPIHTAEKLVTSVHAVALQSAFVYLRTAWLAYADTLTTPQVIDSGVVTRPRSCSELSKRRSTGEAKNNPIHLDQQPATLSFSTYVDTYMADQAETSTTMLLSQFGLARAGTIILPSPLRIAQRQTAKSIGLPCIEWSSFAPQSISPPLIFLKNFYRPLYQGIPPGLSASHLLSQQYNLGALIHKNMKENTSMTSLSQYLALYHLRRDARERMKVQVFVNSLLTQGRTQGKNKVPWDIQMPTVLIDISKGIVRNLTSIAAQRLPEGPCVVLSYKIAPESGQTTLYSHSYNDAVAEEYVDRPNSPLTQLLLSQLPTHSSVFLLLRVLSFAQCISPQGGIVESHSALQTDMYPVNLKYASFLLPYTLAKLHGGLPASMKYYLPLEHIPQTLKFLLNQQHIMSLTRILTIIYNMLPSLYGIQRQAFLLATVLDPVVFNSLFAFWYGDVRKMFMYILLYRVVRSADPSHYDLHTLFAKYIEDYASHPSTLCIRKQTLSNTPSLSVPSLVTTLDVHSPVLQFTEMMHNYRLFLSSPVEALNKIELPIVLKDIMGETSSPQSSSTNNAHATSPNVSQSTLSPVNSLSPTTSTFISSKENNYHVAPYANNIYQNRASIITPSIQSTFSKTGLSGLFSAILPSWLSGTSATPLTPNLTASLSDLSIEDTHSPSNSTLDESVSTNNTCVNSKLAVYTPTCAVLPTPSVALASIECNNTYPTNGVIPTGYLLTVPELFVDLQFMHYIRQIIEYYQYQVWRHFILTSIHKGYHMAQGYTSDPTTCSICTQQIPLTNDGAKQLHEHAHRFPMTPTIFKHLTAFQLSPRQLAVAADALSEYAAHTIVFIHLNYHYSISQLKTESLINSVLSFVGSDLARIHATEMLTNETTRKYTKVHQLVENRNPNQTQLSLALNMDQHTHTVSNLLDTYLSGGVVCSNVSGLEKTEEQILDVNEYSAIPASVSLVSADCVHRELPHALPAHIRCVVNPRITSVHPLPMVYPWDYTAPETSHTPLQLHRHHKHSVTPKKEKKATAYTDMEAADIDDLHLGSCLAAFFKASIRAVIKNKGENSVFHKTQKDQPEDIQLHPYASAARTNNKLDLARVKKMAKHMAAGLFGTHTRNTDKKEYAGCVSPPTSRNLTDVTVSRISRESVLHSQKQSITRKIGSAKIHTQNSLPTQEQTAVYNKLLQRMRPYIWKFVLTPRSVLAQHCAPHTANTLTVPVAPTVLQSNPHAQHLTNTLVPLPPKPQLLRAQPIHPLPAAVRTSPHDTTSGELPVDPRITKTISRKGKVINIVESNFANVFYNSAYILSPRLVVPQDK